MLTFFKKKNYSLVCIYSKVPGVAERVNQYKAWNVTQKGKAEEIMILKFPHCTKTITHSKTLQVNYTSVKKYEYRKKL